MWFENLYRVVKKFVSCSGKNCIVCAGEGGCEGVRVESVSLLEATDDGFEVVGETRHDEVVDVVGHLLVKSDGDGAGDGTHGVGVASEGDGEADGVLVVVAIEKGDKRLRDSLLATRFETIVRANIVASAVEVVAERVSDEVANLVLRGTCASEEDGSRRGLGALDALGVVV